MINKDRIVPVTQTDLLSLYGLILYTRGRLEIAEGDGGVFDYDSLTTEGNYLCNEPVKRIVMNGENTEAPFLHFVAGYDFEGVELEGQLIKRATKAKDSTAFVDIAQDAATLYVTGFDGGSFFLREVCPSL